MADVILALSAAWIAGFPISGVTFATYRSVLETWLAAQTPRTDTGASTQPRMIATAATGARQRPRRGPSAGGGERRRAVPVGLLRAQRADLGAQPLKLGVFLFRVPGSGHRAGPGAVA